MPTFSFAANLLVYPPEHVIYGEYAYEDWDAEKIKFILNFLVPRNMRVDILSKSFDKSGGNTSVLHFGDSSFENWLNYKICFTFSFSLS